MSMTNARSAQIALKAKRMREDRWFIQFSLKGSYNPRTGKYAYAVWPILFTSQEAAWYVVEHFPIFANADKMRIKSASVEKVRR